MEIISVVAQNALAQTCARGIGSKEQDVREIRFVQQGRWEDLLIHRQDSGACARSSSEQEPQTKPFKLIRWSARDCGW